MVMAMDDVDNCLFLLCFQFEPRLSISHGHNIIQMSLIQGGEYADDDLVVLVDTVSHPDCVSMPYLISADLE
jgi:hypothetical protein